MKIVHVVESLDVGGLESMVLTLATAQRRQGHEVEIICLWHRGALAAKAAEQGFVVGCCEKRRGLDLLALRALRRMLRRAWADVLHTHNSMAHYYAVGASLGLKIPRVVSTRHGMGSLHLTARRERLYRLAMRRTHAAVSVCAAASQRFVAQRIIPASKALVIPNGIDLSRSHERNVVRTARLREDLGLPVACLVFGTVGRLHEAKRQTMLLNALRSLLDEGHNAALVIVGEGEQRAALEAEIRELGLQREVRLMGSRSDVPDLLAAMDVFVLPSRTEGYSLALVEACAAALPIVATDVGGNSEIVTEGLNGILIARDDSAGLLQAMAELLANEPRRLRMGRAGREWALREGSLQTMLERYQAIYRDRLPAGSSSVR